MRLELDWAKWGWTVNAIEAYWAIWWGFNLINNHFIYHTLFFTILLSTRHVIYHHLLSFLSTYNIIILSAIILNTNLMIDHLSKWAYVNSRFLQKERRLKPIDYWYGIDSLLGVWTGFHWWSNPNVCIFSLYGAGYLWRHVVNCSLIFLVAH